MDPKKLAEIAERVHALREIFGFSPEEMAQAVHLTPEEYLDLEGGEKDFSFTFLYLCAEKLGVDMIELLTGENPHLSGYSITRSGKGLPIKRQEFFEYYHLAPNFSRKLTEPFLCRAPYKEEYQNAELPTSRHSGQEFNYIVSGTLKFVYENHTEVLNPGDSVLYDATRVHGMMALDGTDCWFLAIILKDPSEDEKQ